MNNMRIAVCDDEKQIVEHIEKQIIRYANSFNMVINTDIFLDGQMLISELSSGVHYDIVILDICMPEKSGIDIGVYIREVMNDNISQIIYISSERQYAMELFKVQPLDFLIKPVEYDNLVNVLNKAVHLLGISNNVLTYEKNSSINRVLLSDIRYIMSSGRKIIIKFADGGQDSFYDSMDRIYDSLKDNYFIRVHKSYIVNYNYVRKIYASKVIIDNGEEIPVSRNRRGEINRICMQ